jgi:hypothetical protein
MVRIPTEHEQQQEEMRRKNDEKIKNLLKEQFIKKWVGSSEKERAEMVFEALSEKADKDHYHFGNDKF